MLKNGEKRYKYVPTGHLESLVFFSNIVNTEKATKSLGVIDNVETRLESVYIVPPYSCLYLKVLEDHRSYKSETYDLEYPRRLIPEGFEVEKCFYVKSDFEIEDNSTLTRKMRRKLILDKGRGKKYESDLRKYLSGKVENLDKYISELKYSSEEVD